MDTHDDRSAGLLAWQLSLYPAGHQTRSNLVTHAITSPLFMTGTLALLAALPVRSGWPALTGAVCWIIALALQGRGHKGEPVGPVPFRGPLDLPLRFFAEQWITFPRFVLNGGFARAWRASAARKP